MLDGGITSLWRHRPFKSADLEICPEFAYQNTQPRKANPETLFLKSVCNKVKEVDKLAKNNGFSHGVLQAKVRELFDKGLYLR